MLSLGLNADHGLQTRSPINSLNFLFKSVSKVTKPAWEMAKSFVSQSVPEKLFGAFALGTWASKKTMTESLHEASGPVSVVADERKQLNSDSLNELSSYALKLYNKEKHDELKDASENGHHLSVKQYEELAHLDVLEKELQEKPGYKESSKVSKTEFGTQKAPEGSKLPGMWVAPSSSNSATAAASGGYSGGNTQLTGLTPLQDLVLRKVLSNADLEDFKLMLENPETDLQQKFPPGAPVAGFTLIQALVSMVGTSQIHVEMFKLLLGKATKQDLEQRFPQGSVFAGLTLIQAIVAQKKNPDSQLEMFKLLLSDKRINLKQKFVQGTGFEGQTLIQSLVDSEEVSDNQLEMFKLLLGKATEEDLKQSFPQKSPFAGYTLMQLLVAKQKASENQVEMFKLLLGKATTEDLRRTFPSISPFAGLTLMHVFVGTEEISKTKLEMFELFVKKAHETFIEREQLSREQIAGEETLKRHLSYRQNLEWEMMAERERIELEATADSKKLDAPFSFIQKLVDQYRDFSKSESDARKAISKSSADEFENKIRQPFIKKNQEIKQRQEASLKKQEEQLERARKQEAQERSRLAAEKHKKDKAEQESFFEKERNGYILLAKEQESGFKSIGAHAKGMRDQIALYEQQKDERYKILKKWAQEFKELSNVYQEDFREARRMELEEAEKAWQEYVEGLLKELEASQEEEIVSANMPLQAPTPSSVTAASMPQEDSGNAWINWRHIFEGHTGSLMESEKSIFLPRYSQKEELQKIMLDALAKGKPVSTDGDKIVFGYRFLHGIGFAQGFQTSAICVVVRYSGNKRVIITAYPVPEEKLANMLNPKTNHGSATAAASS